jgi:hypothetical protein
MAGARKSRRAGGTLRAPPAPQKGKSSMYTIQIPRTGWVRDRIEGGSAPWRGNLACPRAVVRQALDDRRQLVVTLVEVGKAIEVEDAVIEEWQEESQAEAGGYWVEGPGVSARQIQLVR